VKYETIVIDGMNLLHRAAYTCRDLGTIEIGGEGVPTGAVYGFLRSLLSVIKHNGTEGCRVIICWEGGYKHRLEIDPEYKANRRSEVDENQKSAAQSFYSQRRVLQALLQASGWEQAVSPGYEADDLMATLAATLPGTVLLYTNDRDLHQSVTETVHVLAAYKGKDKFWTPEAVLEEWGVSPIRVAEHKALAGDMGDNIPGCPGCGAGWATKILRAYPSLDSVLEAAGWGTLRGMIEGKLWESASMGKKIRDNVAVIRRSYDLAKVVRDCPIEYKTREIRKDALKDLLLALQFNSFLKDEKHGGLLREVP